MISCVPKTNLALSPWLSSSPGSGLYAQLCTKHYKTTSKIKQNSALKFCGFKTSAGDHNLGKRATTSTRHARAAYEIGTLSSKAKSIPKSGCPMSLMLSFDVPTSGFAQPKTAVHGFAQRPLFHSAHNPSPGAASGHGCP